MSKELTGTVVLKNNVESSKFSVVFPMEVRMKCIQTDGNKVMCQHPRYKQIWIILNDKDIRNLKWD
jgi:hypothetical protein